MFFIFFFQAEDGIRDLYVTGVQTCALPILLDHVDAQVVSCVDAEVRPVFIAQCKAPQFGAAIERRVLHSLYFRNVHQAAHGFFVKNLAVRRKHWSELEREDMRKSLACSLVNSSFLLRGLSMQPARLKQNRNSTAPNNGIHLLPVQRNDLAGLPLDVSPRHEWNILPQRIPSPPQNISLF